MAARTARRAHALQVTVEFLRPGSPRCDLLLDDALDFARRESVLATNPVRAAIKLGSPT